jgi:hypothetical protein
MWDVDDPRRSSVTTQRPRSAVLAASGQAVRSRQWPTQSGRSVDATDAGAHAATRRAGGARIGWPRAKLSTMLIAAPQCGQTKVGGTMATDAAAADGGSTAVATTCSSSRAWARCSRRPALASRSAKDSSVNAVVLESVLTCPRCGFAKVESMPTDACLYFYECDRCKVLLRPNPGDCCVFCSFGSVKCPPVQQEMGCCNTR